MSARSLDAAGILDPQMREGYEKAHALLSEHGRTYALATHLLPPEKRPYVWALYGFARKADDYVDSLENPDPDALVEWGARFLDALNDGVTRDPIARAMLHTMKRWNIPRRSVEAFLASMRMDITVTEYETYADLEKYMYGSAAVIGMQMLPILEPLTPDAAPRARALGEAFQMSNFIRDVGDDLRRGRVYLPQEDLRAFGVTRETLERGSVTTLIRELLQFEIARTRSLYEFAEPGIDMLHPTSRDAIRTAFVLYGEILDMVERAGYQVLRQRVSVPLSRRAQVVLPALLRARSARRRAEAPLTPLSTPNTGNP